MTEPQLTRRPVPNRHPDLDALINERADLLNDKRNIEGRIADIDVLLVERLKTTGGRYEVAPGVGVRVQQPSARFNSRKAFEVLTTEQWNAIQVPKADVGKAKALLPGALVDLCYVADSAPSIRTI